MWYDTVVKKPTLESGLKFHLSINKKLFLATNLGGDHEAANDQGTDY
ncbi:hypothetical protein [Halobacillus naozhouensis]|uniref:Uncharacterized protein n=1 Tax=Halobacillus naozhouensis TaxID=554880 RepID=A0ABY8IWW2_9BACI|nr:hypothetical protein [Halobacillus naozhouensis]WFT73146.1 hypothetical protein P9989_12095 [Halobacillus naozhouensis]